MSLWTYRARLLSIHDGDTGAFLLDLGTGVRAEVDLRLVGVRAPELSQAGGREALAYVAEWIDRLPDGYDWPLIVQTVKTKTREPGERRSFTRYLAHVYEVGMARCLNVDAAKFLAGHPEWPPGQ